MALATYIYHIFFHSSPSLQSDVEKGSPRNDITIGAPSALREIGSTNDGTTSSSSARLGDDEAQRETGGNNEGEDGEDGEDGDSNSIGEENTRRPNCPSRALRQIGHAPSSAWFRIKNLVFPPRDEEELKSFVPHYRTTPIIAGILIPFCVLLSIPGLTEHWFVITENNVIIETRPNPPLLVAGLACSVTCAVFANICLIFRFLEKRVKTMTVACISFLLTHNILILIVISVFASEHDSSSGYTYGESFWVTLCATIASAIVNVTLIWDFLRTKDFDKSGSGLTRKQRSLVIIIIILFCYIAFGAAINSLLIKLSFINGLYFTVVSIETIGFGDIVPITSGARVFVCFYSALGILNLGVAVGMFRETVMESLEVNYRKRMQGILENRRAARRRKRIEKRWRGAVKWRLRERSVPIWVKKKNVLPRSGRWSKWRDVVLFIHAVLRPSTLQQSASHGPHGMRLNLEALTHSQLEAAALEAGVPLDTLLPPDFNSSSVRTPEEQERLDHRPAFPSPASVHDQELNAESLTYGRLGRMAHMLRSFAISVYNSAGPPSDFDHDNNEFIDDINEASASPYTSHGVPFTHTLTGQSISSDTMNSEFHATVEDTERKASYTRLITVWMLFFLFWAVGSVIFMNTEGWSFGVSVYFCFITFMTIGYGDFSPQTPAGRSIFVFWALLGVGTMAILISVILETYTSRYEGIIKKGPLDKAAQGYREHNQEELATEELRPPINDGPNVSVRFHPQEPPSSSMRNKEQERSTPANAFSEDLSQPDRYHSPDQPALHTAKSAQASTDIQQAIELSPAQEFKAQAQVLFDQSLESLLDHMIQDHGISEQAKADFLSDQDARDALLNLSVENAIKELLKTAKQGIQAWDERNNLISEGQLVDRPHAPSNVLDCNNDAPHIDQGVTMKERS